MTSLKAHQLALVAAAADKLPAEKRATFLERVAARLRLHGRRFTDAELELLMARALIGLSPANWSDDHRERPPIRASTLSSK